MGLQEIFDKISDRLRLETIGMFAQVNLQDHFAGLNQREKMDARNNSCFTGFNKYLMSGNNTRLLLYNSDVRIFIN